MLRDVSRTSAARACPPQPGTDASPQAVPRQRQAEGVRPRPAAGVPRLVSRKGHPVLDATLPAKLGQRPDGGGAQGARAGLLPEEDGGAGVQHVVADGVHPGEGHGLALQEAQLLVEARAAVVHEDQAQAPLACLVGEPGEGVARLPRADLRQARALCDAQQVARDADVQGLHLEAHDPSTAGRPRPVAAASPGEADARVTDEGAELQAHAVPLPRPPSVRQHAVEERTLQVRGHLQPVVEPLQREADHGVKHGLRGAGAAMNCGLDLLYEHGKLVLRMASVASHLGSGESAHRGLVDEGGRFPLAMHGARDNLLHVAPQGCQRRNQAPSAVLVNRPPRSLAARQQHSEVQDVGRHTAGDPGLEGGPQARERRDPLQGPQQRVAVAEAQVVDFTTRSRRYSLKKRRVADPQLGERPRGIGQVLRRELR
mmetsp:Transcript_30534/g.94889  ORF Transcript_30534/g.94889 Transcript_30534/m.94889 type:complete len:428 (-) Transcript_30534:79-1362(-)